MFNHIFLLFVVSTAFSTPVLAEEILIKKLVLDINDVRRLPYPDQSERHDVSKKQCVDLVFHQESKEVSLIGLQSGSCIINWYDDLDSISQKWVVDIRKSSGSNQASEQILVPKNRQLEVTAKVISIQNLNAESVGMDTNISMGAMDASSPKVLKRSIIKDRSLNLSGAKENTQIIGEPKIVMAEGVEAKVSVGNEIKVDDYTEQEHHGRKTTIWKKIGLEIKFNLLKVISGSALLSVGMKSLHRESSDQLQSSELSSKLWIKIGTQQQVGEFDLSSIASNEFGHQFWKSIPILSPLLGEKHQLKNDAKAKVIVSLREIN